jgi:hypothetical protein
MKPPIFLLLFAASIPCFAENTSVKPVDRPVKNPETAKPVQIAIASPAAIKAGAVVVTTAPMATAPHAKVEVKTAAPAPTPAPAPVVASAAPVTVAVAKEQPAEAAEVKATDASATGLMAPVVADDGLSQKEVMARYLSGDRPSMQRPGMQLGVADVLTLTTLETIKVSK